MSRVSPQRLQHLAHRIGDVAGRVVGDARLEAGGEVALDPRHLPAHQLDHVQGVGVGQGPDPHEDRGLSGEAHLGVVVLGPQHHVGDLAQPHDAGAGAFQRQFAELLHGAQVGVGCQVDLDVTPLAAPKRRDEVVCRQGLAHLGGGDVERGHALRLEPDAHREGARPQDLGALHPFQGGEARLHHAHQVIGDLVLLEQIRAEAQVGRGEAGVRRLDVDGGHLRLGREVAAHLVHLGADLGQRPGGVEVELEPHADGGEPEGALGLHVLDAVGGGDGALQRRGDEAAHQVGTGAHVHGGDRYGGILAARVLAHLEGAHRLEAGDDDDEVHHYG